jgi:hypothetical protein
MKTFWLLSSVVLFLLALIYFSLGLCRRNLYFSCWISIGILFQIFVAVGLAAGSPRPSWMAHAKVGFDLLSYLLAAAAITMAAARRSDPVHMVILQGLGGMLALQLAGRIFGIHLLGPLVIWLRNIAFFGPALWMILCFSDIGLTPAPATPRIQPTGETLTAAAALAHSEAN